jgi:hypothetical protein
LLLKPSSFSTSTSIHRPLAVEAVLVALPLAEHGVVALVEVLVGAAPGVVDAHRVVRGDRPVQEAVAALRVLVAGKVARHRLPLAPDLDLIAFQRGTSSLPDTGLNTITPLNKKPVPDPGREVDSRGTTRT